jgi:hypothetical protein
VNQQRHGFFEPVVSAVSSGLRCHKYFARRCSISCLCTRIIQDPLDW